MNKESLDKANKIMDEINTLEAEISELEFKHKSVLQKLFEFPPKKTFKNLWCISGIDSIGSCVMLQKDEIDVLASYKRSKVCELRSELNKL